MFKCAFFNLSNARQMFDALQVINYHSWNIEKMFVCVEISYHDFVNFKSSNSIACIGKPNQNLYQNQKLNLLPKS